MGNKPNKKSNDDRIFLESQAKKIKEQAGTIKQQETKLKTQAAAIRRLKKEIQDLNAKIKQHERALEDVKAMASKEVRSRPDSPEMPPGSPRATSTLWKKKTEEDKKLEADARAQDAEEVKVEKTMTEEEKIEFQKKKRKEAFDAQQKRLDDWYLANVVPIFATK